MERVLILMCRFPEHSQKSEGLWGGNVQAKYDLWEWLPSFTWKL